MPRDLDLEERPISLTESPHSTEESEEQHVNGGFVIVRDQKGDESMQSNSSAKIHPYTRPLTISDLDSCIALENAAFPIEQERCSREKVSQMFRYLFDVATRDDPAEVSEASGFLLGMRSQIRLVLPQFRDLRG
jgi:hypothetical protein